MPNPNTGPTLAEVLHDHKVRLLRGGPPLNYTDITDAELEELGVTHREAVTLVPLAIETICGHSYRRSLVFDGFRHVGEIRRKPVYDENGGRRA